jgi:hypothetical protein
MAVVGASKEALKMNKPVVCICAAVITEDGTIIRGHRHEDCIKSILRRNKKVSKTPDAQGFITSDNIFVTRVEGRKLQDAAGIRSKSVDGYMSNTLYSEDLY